MPLGPSALMLIVFLAGLAGVCGVYLVSLAFAKQNGPRMRGPKR